MIILEIVPDWIRKNPEFGIRNPESGIRNPLTEETMPRHHLRILESIKCKGDDDRWLETNAAFDLIEIFTSASNFVLKNIGRQLQIFNDILTIATYIGLIIFQWRDVRSIRWSICRTNWFWRAVKSELVHLINTRQRINHDEDSDRSVMQEISQEFEDNYQLSHGLCLQNIKVYDAQN